MGASERDRAEILARLSVNHPGLGTSHFKATSPYDAGYNCMAHAGGETKRWWDPCAYAGLYWPGGPQSDDLEGWSAGYSQLGYRRCESPELEPGIEKIAFYCDEHGSPTHVARQLESGHWTSKIGKSEDIEHDLAGLEGKKYGTVAFVMQRTRKAQHVLDLESAPAPAVE
ncbi:DUF7689 domain-containing protein [Longimicrobium terrae]|uniref:DUF7689 domain-containing protein n=1 Tax=Longimicrobium terrae TaxID=1639882 RepID=A0A841H6N9_9BACT|nr:hypothetical protein [Longimicrobium terrae]MBB4639449.1 hypothetical protein [Longimicrobium terrae]MBB6073821.1 hypothetical protein [Longimicrobium terrae]NNC33209.1 hypothetical protein [Longimicrobium terrae]